MPVPMPGHLVVPERYLPPSGKVSHGEKITLRCDNGQVLDIPTTANASTVKDSFLNVVRLILNPFPPCQSPSHAIAQHFSSVVTF